MNGWAVGEEKGECLLAADASGGDAGGDAGDGGVVGAEVDVGVVRVGR